MPRKWKPEEYEYQQEYIKENIKFVNIPFNMKNSEDAELLEHLNNIEGKRATYLKQLIRRDMIIQPQRYPPTRYSEELCGCPICKHEVTQNMNVCNYCGVKLDWKEENIMKYRIKPEYLDSWEGGDSPSNPDRIVTQEEVERLAEDWEIPVEELLEQLIPQE